MSKKAAAPKTFTAQDLQALTSVLMGRAQLAASMGLQYGGDRNVYEALGYEQGDIIYDKYLARFLRQDIAAAVIDRPVDATWRGGFEILESDDDQKTPLEKAFSDLYDSLALHSKFARLDRLAGIGKYGILLLGLNDVRQVEDFANPVTGTRLKLLWVKPFGEGSAPLATIEWETDPQNPRYGQPNVYTITINNTSVGGNQIIRAHHSRVIHVADGLLESEIEGTPRLQVVFNRLMDLEKLVGASAEMFWRGARPGYQAVADKDTPLPTDFLENLQIQADEYENNLRRILAVAGVEFKALASQVADPEKHVLIQLQMISAVTNIPLRILTGSEVGQLASEQDRNNWLDYVHGRRLETAEPLIIRPFVDRCIKYGVLPPPDVEYSVKWPDLYAMSEKEKADIGNTRATAIKNYASAPGAETVMPPTSFRKVCLGLTDEENELVEEELKAAMAEEAALQEPGPEPEPAPEPSPQDQPPNEPANGGANGPAR